MSISIVSFRWMQSSVLCPCTLWKRQHFDLSKFGRAGIDFRKRTLPFWNSTLAHSVRIRTLPFKGIFPEIPSQALVVFGVLVLVFFLFVSSQTIAFLLSGTLGIFLVPRILDRVGGLVFLVLDVRLYHEEESVQGGGSLDAHILGEIGARMEALFQKILLHVCYNGHLDELLVEYFNIRSEGLVFPLDDGLKRGF